MLALFFAYISVKDIEDNDKLQIVFSSQVLGFKSLDCVISAQGKQIFYMSTLLDKEEESVAEGQPLKPNWQDGRSWPILYTCYLPPSGTEIKAVLIDVYGGGAGREYYVGRRNNSYSSESRIDKSFFYRILSHNGVAVIQAQLSDLTKPFLGADGLTKPQPEYSKAELDLVLYDIAYLRTHLNDIKTKNPEDPINVRLQELASKPTFITGFSFGGFMSFDILTKNPSEYAIDGQPYNSLFDGAIVQSGFITRFKDKPNDTLSKLLKDAKSIDDIESILGPHLMPEFSPILGLKNLEKPVLFMHGTADDTVNARHTAEAKIIAEKFGKGHLISPYIIQNVAHGFPSSSLLQRGGRLTFLDGYAQVALAFIDSVIEGTNTINPQQKSARAKIEKYRLSKIKEDANTSEKSFVDIIPLSGKTSRNKHIQRELIADEVSVTSNDRHLIKKLIKNTFRYWSVDGEYVAKHKDEIIDRMLIKLNEKMPYDDAAKEQVRQCYIKLLESVVEFFNKTDTERARTSFPILSLFLKAPDRLQLSMFLVFYEEMTRPVYCKTGVIFDWAEKTNLPLPINTAAIDKDKIRQTLGFNAPDWLLDRWIDEISQGKELRIPSLTRDEWRTMFDPTDESFSSIRPLEFHTKITKAIELALRETSDLRNIALVEHEDEIRKIAVEHEDEIRPIIQKYSGIMSFEELKAKIEEGKARIEAERKQKLGVLRAGVHLSPQMQEARKRTALQRKRAAAHQENQPLP